MAAIKQPCAVTGCAKMTAGYSRYCTNHRAKARKNGHPEQSAVKRKELAPFEAIVAKYLRNNPDASAWDVLDQLWRDCVRQARTDVEQAQRGPYNRITVAAAREILKADRDADWKEIMAVVASVWMLNETSPRRFKSDEAVRVQVARLVRKITPVGGERYLDSQGKGRKTEPYIPLAQSTLFGQTLIDVFAGLGMKLLELESAEIARYRLMQQELANGYASLR